MDSVLRKYFSSNWFSSQERKNESIILWQNEVDNNQNGKPSTLFEKWFSLFALGVDISFKRYRCIQLWSTGHNGCVHLNNLIAVLCSKHDCFLSNSDFERLFATHYSKHNGCYRRHRRHRCSSSFLFVYFYNLLIFMVWKMVNAAWEALILFELLFECFTEYLNTGAKITGCSPFESASICIEFIIYAYIHPRTTTTNARHKVHRAHWSVSGRDIWTNIL